MSGIYAIKNKITGECYVGESVNIPRRFYEHMRCLLKGKHPSAKLQNAVNRFGIENFSFEILEICHESELIKREQFWINKLDSVNNGYNTLSDQPPLPKLVTLFQPNTEARAKAIEKAKELAEKLGRIPTKGELMKEGLTEYYARIGMKSLEGIKSISGKFQPDLEAQARAIEKGKKLKAELGRVPTKRELIASGLTDHYARVAMRALKRETKKTPS